MILRRALLPLAVVVALGLALAGVAQAAPVSTLVPTPSVAFGGNVHVGIGVVVPIGPRHRRAYPVDHAPGRWIVRRERVWVPGEVIGYDRHGHTIATEGFWTVQRTRVWVPDRRYVAPARPRGRIAVGLRFH